jgi:rubredoxin
MRYILHYTDPGDIVFDGFCGTGMTGVAAQLCGDKKAVKELGYRVDAEGIVWEGSKAISRLGVRKAVLNDLSPAATFIAYNYNTPMDAVAFEREAKRILWELEEECGWMYETWHPNCDAPNRVKGKINYTVWSDVFVCPTCVHEMIFWDVAVDQEKGEILDAWNCPGCATLLAKSPSKDSGAIKAEHAWETRFDRELKQTIRQACQVPVLINYSVGKKRFEKKPDAADLELIHKIEETKIPNPIPINQIPKGDKTSDPFNLGITHVHHFYTRRNLWVLASALKSCLSSKNVKAFWVTASMIRTSKLYKFTLDRKMGTVSGTLYIPSLWTENSPVKLLNYKLSISEAFLRTIQFNSINNGSSSDLKSISSEELDYIFVDPPFGSNLMYSELNFLWESWLEVLTNNKPEAIINNTQHKAMPEYMILMGACFREFYRVLKPGRWMTVEFHNSQNAIWNTIQEAVTRAGFVIADVSSLDKQQGSFNQVTATGSVKQDLIISAYKPNDNLEELFRLHAGNVEGAWDFVRYHLGQLPVAVESGGELETVAERQDFLLFDRMLAFHIQRGAAVPLSAGEFYGGLRQRFVERDGMFFLAEQVPQYDSARLRLGRVAQLSLFVKDEKTTIQWLRQRLDPSLGGEPATFQDLQPVFLQQLHQAKHESMPELHILLEQNFLQDEAGYWYVPDPSKVSDLEKVRLKSLLREFGTYVEGSGRLRQFRSEAVRAGFGECWKKRDYATIMKVAERMPESVLHEDPDLLMYYDNATLRVK